MQMLEYRLTLTCVTKKINHTNCVLLVRKFFTLKMYTVFHVTPQKNPSRTGGKSEDPT